MAFTVPEKLFKLTIIFLELTNLLATFQAMMNKLLRDLINIGKIAAFIDNLMVGTESEEGHDELVKEILKRMKKNDLYMKPEKCR